MKIRNGFVSNSSTSSFVIFGYRLTEELKSHLITNAFALKKEDRGRLQRRR